MRLSPIRQNIPKRTRQDVQMRGINLTDRYTDGEMESCKGISSDRYPYITTQQQPAGVEEIRRRVNQWDGEWEFLTMDEDDTRICNANHIPVRPNTVYRVVGKDLYITITNESSAHIMECSAGQTFVTDSDSIYLDFSTQEGFGHWEQSSPEAERIWVPDTRADVEAYPSINIGINYPETETQYKAYVPTDISVTTNIISMFAWEQLFVVTDEPHDGGFKCFYGGTYCGDAVNTELPKQYAVVNNRLVMFPDKIYFNLYDETMTAHQLGTAARLMTVNSGTIVMRKAVTS